MYRASYMVSTIRDSMCKQALVLEGEKLELLYTAIRSERQAYWMRLETDCLASYIEIAQEQQVRRHRTK